MYKLLVMRSKVRWSAGKLVQWTTLEVSAGSVWDFCVCVCVCVYFRMSAKFCFVFFPFLTKRKNSFKPEVNVNMKTVGL